MKISVHFGERDRSDGRFLADHVVGAFAAAGLEAVVLMRGVEGFGAKHLERTDRLLTLSEDLPVIAIGVGSPERVRLAAREIEAVEFGGLILMETVTIVDPANRIEVGPELTLKLSVFMGRDRRIGGRPAYEAVVNSLRRSGVGGASVLVGVDGVLGGARQRAGFFARNVDVPALVISIGDRESIANALSELGEVPGPSLVTLERADVRKADGSAFALPAAIGAGERSPGDLVRLTLYSSEGSRIDGSPVHIEAIRRLRAAGAAGATTFRGAWGFDGNDLPHGESMRSLRRRVPTVTEVVDTPANSDRWLGILDGVTPSRGLITSEVVFLGRDRSDHVAGPDQ